MITLGGPRTLLLTLQEHQARPTGPPDTSAGRTALAATVMGLAAEPGVSAKDQDLGVFGTEAESRLRKPCVPGPESPQAVRRQPTEALAETRV